MLRWICFFLATLSITPALRAQGDQELAPMPAQVPSPPDNPTTSEKVELGKWLFFDPRLSGDNQMSCATCHVPEKAFTDGLALSPGAGGRPLTRNSQSCLNVALFDSLFWDGRVATLEEQALIPIESKVEMNQDLGELERELSAIPEYIEAFKRAFDSEPNRDSIAKALAAFQRTLVTGPSPVDRYLAGEKDALSANAKAGLELFRGEAGCTECHNGPLLSDGKFYRLGTSYRDVGRGEVSKSKNDRFRFRTPSLRNVAQTAPYMHDGSMATLEEVVTFYYRGIPSYGPNGLSPDVAALSGQSFSEISLLVEFLEALSGELPEITAPELP